MDKGTPGVTTTGAGPAASIEREIEAIRGNLDGLVSELDHRRHRLSPLVAAHRHPAGFALAGVVLAGAITAGVLVHRARERRRHSWIGRGKRLKAALGDLMEGRAATRPPSLGARLLIAIATAATAAAGKRLAAQFLAKRR